MMKIAHDSDGWRTSSYSAEQTDCVQLHQDGAVRDSKNPDGPVLKLRFAGLVSAVKTDRLTR